MNINPNQQSLLDINYQYIVWIDEQVEIEQFNIYLWSIRSSDNYQFMIPVMANCWKSSDFFDYKTNFCLKLDDENFQFKWGMWKQNMLKSDKICIQEYSFFLQSNLSYKCLQMQFKRVDARNYQKLLICCEEIYNKSIAVV